MKNNTSRDESKNYCLSADRAKELMNKTDRCSVIVTPQNEIGRECKIDVMAAKIETAKEIKDNIMPTNQGDSIDPQYAAEFGEKVVIVTDKSKGISTRANERAENETQKLSREKVELAKRVAEKYSNDDGER